jgi:hypothetical protein
VWSTNGCDIFVDYVVVVNCLLILLMYLKMFVNSLS